VRGYDEWVVEFFLGLFVLMAGDVLFRHRARVARELSEWARASNDPNHSLLNLERAEAIRDAESHPDAARGQAFSLACMVLVAGAALTTIGLIEML
jgi:hypothetical protein